MKNHDGGSGLWGVFVIYLGVTFLGVNTGVIDREIWEYLFGFWPILLILGGIHIILGDNLLSKLIMTLLAVAVFGAILINGLQYYGAPIYYGWGLDKIPYIDCVNNYFLLKK